MSFVGTSSDHQQYASSPAGQGGRKADFAENAGEDALADIRELQAVSAKLVQEDANGLYDTILDAALRLLRSDMASIQLYDPVRDGLTLLTTRGFDAEHIKLFDWVGRDAGTSCAQALRQGARAVIPDIELCTYVVGTPAHAPLRLCGIRGALSTPLISRTGAVIGMITNHWRAPFEPTERSLLLIDVLARQAADLIDRMRHEERIVLLAREAEHRAKNMLASVLAVVRLTKADTADTLKAAIVGRVTALDNVHRLLVQSNWSGADLHTLITQELSPYRTAEDLKAELAGPDIALETNAAQAISMTVHELATNAAKYGALSMSGGHVLVQWFRKDNGLVLRWKERGGPAVEEPSMLGVGSRVIDSMIRGQLNGTIEFDWNADGLSCKFSLPI